MAKLDSGKDWWKLPLAMATGGFGAMPLKKTLDQQAVNKYGAKLDENVRSHLDELRRTAELNDQQLYDMLIKSGMDDSQARRMVGESGSAKAVEAARGHRKTMGGYAGAEMEGMAASEAARQESEKKREQDRLAQVQAGAKIAGAADSSRLEQIAANAANLANTSGDVNRGMTSSAARPYIAENEADRQKLIGRKSQFDYASVPDPEEERIITRDDQRGRAVLSGDSPIRNRRTVQLNRLEQERNLSDPVQEFKLAESTGKAPFKLHAGEAYVTPGKPEISYLNASAIPGTLTDYGRDPNVLTGPNIFGAEPRLRSNTGPGAGTKYFSPDSKLPSPTMNLDPSAWAKEQEEARRLHPQWFQ